MQLTANGVINGSAYALLGVSFGLILSVTGRFHIAFTFSYALAAYLAAEIGERSGLPFWPSLVAGALCAAASGALVERFVYRPVANKAGASALLMIFVASLGLAIVGRNAISLIWFTSPSKQISGFTNGGVSVGSVTVTTLGLLTTAVSLGLIVLTWLLLQYTTLGRSIRAVRVNPEMSLVVGIDPRAIYIVVLALGSFLAGVGAVLDATKTSATPDMGLNPLFYAFVVSFLGGLGSSPLTVALVGIALGLAESWSALLLPTQWSALVVFAILFVYVALRPVPMAALVKRMPRLRSGAARA